MKYFKNIIQNTIHFYTYLHPIEIKQSSQIITRITQWWMGKKVPPNRRRGKLLDISFVHQIKKIQMQFKY